MWLRQCGGAINDVYNFWFLSLRLKPLSLTEAGAQMGDRTACTLRDQLPKSNMNASGILNDPVDYSNHGLLHVGLFHERGNIYYISAILFRCILYLGVFCTPILFRDNLFIKRYLTSFCFSSKHTLFSYINSMNNLFLNNLVLSFGPDNNYNLLNAYLTLF